MLSLVLYCPQIPPNTGNIMRLCSNIGFSLHLIKPLGFNLDDKSLKRAKLDYFSNIDPKIYEDLETYCRSIDMANLVIITKFGKKNILRQNLMKIQLLFSVLKLRVFQNPLSRSMKVILLEYLC